tara:strand:+ start:312 stop:488 length:177 start_codon:yes stop_codon:yes gene_type:complete
MIEAIADVVVVVVAFESLFHCFVYATNHYNFFLFNFLQYLPISLFTKYFCHIFPYPLN